MFEAPGKYAHRGTNDFLLDDDSDTEPPVEPKPKSIFETLSAALQPGSSHFEPLSKRLQPLTGELKPMRDNIRSISENFKSLSDNFNATKSKLSSLKSKPLSSILKPQSPTDEISSPGFDSSSQHSTPMSPKLPPQTPKTPRSPNDPECFTYKDPNKMRSGEIQNFIQKKNVAQGMMDLALVAANCNQLRYVLDMSSVHPYFLTSLALIITSLVLQVIVGLTLLYSNR